MTLTAEFPPGAPTYHRVYFAKEGHQAYQAPSSDVIVTFVVQPHANFTMLHNGDLATTLKISLMVRFGYVSSLGECVVGPLL